MADSVTIRELLAAIPRYLRLVVRLVRDPRVSNVDKSMLAGALAYAVAPIDLIPDFIPIVGQLDDLFFLALAIDRLVTHAGLEVVLEHWEGPEETLAALCTSMDELAERLPAPVRRRLLKGVEDR
jgi:uncharacterized membrane protein YkvA (DUF1232 family)